MLGAKTNITIDAMLYTNNLYLYIGYFCLIIIFFKMTNSGCLKDNINGKVILIINAINKEAIRDIIEYSLNTTLQMMYDITTVNITLLNSLKAKARYDAPDIPKEYLLITIPLRINVNTTEGNNRPKNIPFIPHKCPKKNPRHIAVAA